MANMPLRNVGQYGVVADIDPNDLPPNTFNDGSNVIFNDNRVMRAPVLKDLFNQTVQNPQHIGLAGAFTYNNPDDGAVICVAHTDNTVTSYIDGVADDVTPSGAITSGTDDAPFVHTEVAGLSVLCRKTTEPYIRDHVSALDYSLMSVGDWPSADRAVSMRGFKDFIIALNVTQSGIVYDTMVKWTDVVQYRANPASGVVWTPSAANSAGSTILANFKTPIVDGLPLNNAFIIYSTTETAIMEFTGSEFVFSFRKFYDRDGMISQNCAVSTGKEHYVFGDTDIYMHNGITMESIAVGRVKERIYRELRREDKHKFFVHLDEINDLVYFCYVSDESNIGYPGTHYCNRAAVYNLKSKTWSFVDLPNVVGAGQSNISLSATSYATQTASYAATANPYNSYQDTSPRISAFVSARDDSNSITAGRVYANDLLVTGLLNTVANPEALKPAFVERRGLDLDETQAPLRSYKQVVSMIPQIITVSGAAPVTVKLGFTDLPYDDSPTYVTNYNFVPNIDHKIDSKAAGRLLAYRIEEPSGEYFSFSAADFDLSVYSER